MSTPEDAGSRLAELAAQEAADRAGTPSNEEAPPEEEKLFAGKYRSSEDLEKAYLEAQRLVGQHGSKIGELEQQLQAVQAQQYQEPQQPQMPDYGVQTLPDGTPILTPQQLDELAMESPAQAADLMARYRIFEARMQMEQELKPLRAQLQTQSAASTVEQLRHVVGDDVLNRNKEALAAAIQADRSYFDVEPQVRLQRFKQAIWASEYERATEQPRDAQGRYTPAPDIESGSSAMPDPTPNQPADEFAQEIQALKSYRAPRDAFGEMIPPHLLK